MPDMFAIEGSIVTVTHRRRRDDREAFLQLLLQRAL
jgi:hypothetical protein